MTNFQKVFCVFLSLCFFSVLALLPGPFFLRGNIYRQLPLYCFLEDEASEMRQNGDPETYGLIIEKNGAYLGEKARNGENGGAGENGGIGENGSVGENGDAGENGSVGKNGGVGENGSIGGNENAGENSSAGEDGGSEERLLAENGERVEADEDSAGREQQAAEETPAPENKDKLEAQTEQGGQQDGEDQEPGADGDAGAAEGTGTTEEPGADGETGTAEGTGTAEEPGADGDVGAAEGTGTAEEPGAGGEVGAAEEPGADGDAGAAEGTGTAEEPGADGETGTAEDSGSSAGTDPELEAAAETAAAAAALVPQPQVDLSPEMLADYDYLLNQFFILDPTTATSAGQLDAGSFLAEDLTMKQDASAPQILIYHSHSQETFADSREGEPEDTVVGVGNYLTKLLTEIYGYNVIHVTETFDIVDGEIDRSRAYDFAREYVEQVLAENPTIEVVIDLHRDGVPEERRLVTQINGRDTAQIMFYNGLSYTAANGAVDYLPNPYIHENLAFSFQLEYQAAQYYPQLYRGIYLAALRYNLHLRPKALLLEAGAQTNTVQEVKNAMEPFADILNRVLKGGDK